MTRTVIIGDVHGCQDELQLLLRELGATRADRLVSVGDLLGKGPDSKGVLDWALETPNLVCVQGNHERRFLARAARGPLADGKPLDDETWRQLEPGLERYRRFVDSWPLYLSRRDHLVVHAGFDPRLPLSRQGAERLTTLRRLADTQAPWYEEYRLPKLAVFGHWSRREPVLRENAVGVDTGCVFGGRLSALVLPERRIASVPARRAYKPKGSWA